MKVISEDNKIYNANVSFQTIDEVSGLVFESRGGASGKSNERNTDYSEALETVLKRLYGIGKESVRIQLVSSESLSNWDLIERTIQIDGMTDISLKVKDFSQLRRNISRALSEKKINPHSKGGNGNKRILISTELDEHTWREIISGSEATPQPLIESEIEAAEDEFSPSDAKEARERALKNIAIRRGQGQFREKLLKAYRNSCAITGTEFPAILEAAHIIPYMGKKTNHVTNGLLLRADIHTLFDLGLIGINEKYEVVICSSMNGTEYEDYNGTMMSLPKDKSKQPSQLALKTRPLPKRY